MNSSSAFSALLGQITVQSSTNSMITSVCSVTLIQSAGVVDDDDGWQRLE